MKAKTEREHLRELLMQTVLDNCGEMPVGLVHAVLREVESILMAASNNASVSDLREKIARRM